jgi:hypothetical protein
MDLRAAAIIVSATSAEMTERATRSAVALALLAFASPIPPARAQDLAPRAYVISPLGSHAILVSATFNSGAVLVDPTVPLDDVRGSFRLPVLGYYQSLNVLGRSANVTAMLPYVHGNFTAKVNGADLMAHRSGTADGRVRFAINLHGGPAMGVGEYLKWKEKRLIGASLTVTFPTGQYDRARLINPGTNRWGFKPEIGFSRRWGPWVIDWYTGAWFFTGNRSFFPGNSVRTQKPVGAVEGHAGYYLRPRLWVSFDANFWAGNRSTIDGVRKEDQQRNSRIGATASVPLSRRHSMKFSYSRGAYVTFGGDFRMVTAAWQYSWIRFPR